MYHPFVANTAGAAPTAVTTQVEEYRVARADAHLSSLMANATRNFQLLDNIYPWLPPHIILNLVTLAESAVAVIIYLKNQTLRQKPSRIFTGSFIVSSSLCAAVALSLTTVMFMHHGAFYLSRTGCLLRVLLRYLSSVSILIVACFALDRYVAICWALRYYDLLTEARCCLLCIVCWVAPIVLLSLPCVTELSDLCSYGHDHPMFLVSYAILYSLGAFVTCLLYVLVALEFCRSRNVETCGWSMMKEDNTIRIQASRSAIAVVVLYFLLCLPHVSSGQSNPVEL